MGVHNYYQWLILCVQQRLECKSTCSRTLLCGTHLCHTAGPPWSKPQCWMITLHMICRAQSPIRIWVDWRLCSMAMHKYCDPKRWIAGEPWAKPFPSLTWISFNLRSWVTNFKTHNPPSSSMSQKILQSQSLPVCNILRLAIICCSIAMVPTSPGSWTKFMAVQSITPKIGIGTSIWVVCKTYYLDL